MQHSGDVSGTLSAAGVRTYLYSWEFHDNTTYIDPASKECEKRIGVNCGDYHANEIEYLFDRYKGSNPKGVLMEAIMGRLWTNFAKNGGNPNDNSSSTGGEGGEISGAGGGGVGDGGGGGQGRGGRSNGGGVGSGVGGVRVHGVDQPFVWPEYDADSDKHLVLAETPHASSGMSKEECDFWDTLPTQSGYPN